MNVARLTPAFAASCQGQVHSTFDRIVNVRMSLPSGDRLLTLTASLCPHLPDSVCVEPSVLNTCEIGVSVTLHDDCLRVGSLSFPLVREPYPSLLPLAGSPRTDIFLAATAAIASGFDRMPPALCTHAEQVLCTTDAPHLIGLGMGLTPSFDDACVGVLAVHWALGCPAPFVIDDFDATTDVSARYLRLAQEGYFSEPLMLLMNALFGCGSLENSLQGLLSVGATSGADMIHGIVVALQQAKRSRHISQSNKEVQP